MAVSQVVAFVKIINVKKRPAVERRLVLPKPTDRITAHDVSNMTAIIDCIQSQRSNFK